jgi:hypothetical protein
MESVEEILKMAERIRGTLQQPKGLRMNPSHHKPVHVVYGGADRFDAHISSKFGRLALGLLDSVASDEEEFRKLFNTERVHKDSIPAGVFSSVKNRLSNRPIEDFRIDFEDGYGFRTDEEEDSCSSTVAAELAKGMNEGSLPRMIGIRIKSFQRETFSRSARTLALCLGGLLEMTDGRMPENFVVTLPKIRGAAEVSALDNILSLMEQRHGLPANSIGIELMAETPEAILLIDELVGVSPHRTRAVHFGAYDYNSELGITGGHQDIWHPASAFAKSFIQLKLAGSGVRISDSVTTLMPIGPHKDAESGTPEHIENRERIRHALSAHYANITESMRRGFFQSWDLHPGQLVARYAAVFSFFRKEADSQAERLRGFLNRSTKATMTGNQFDDAASAQGCLNFFRRAHSSGALTERQIEELTGIELVRLLGMSFNDLR